MEETGEHTSYMSTSYGNQGCTTSTGACPRTIWQRQGSTPPTCPHPMATSDVQLLQVHVLGQYVRHMGAHILHVHIL